MGTAYALRRLAKQRLSLRAVAQWAPITVLKPLKGLEPGLEANLRSFFSQNYPEFELIFCVADADDPCLPLVARLLDEHPRVRARLHVGSSETEVNPKICNLLPGYALARHELILISDSNVRVGPTHLREVVEKMGEDVGVVTAVIVGTEAVGIGARLEAVFLNTFHARWMQILYALGHPCVVGKTMLFRRSAMDRFGGLKCLGPFLAEDYMAGQIMRRLGLRTELVASPVPQPIGDSTFERFWMRHVRWGRLRRAQLPPSYYAEPFQSLLGSGICGAIAMAILGVPLLPFVAMHILLWGLADFLLMNALGSPPRLATPAVWLLREALALPHWIHVGLGKTIDWRGRSMRLCPGGLIEAV